METVTCNLCGSQGVKTIFQMPDWSFDRWDHLFTFVQCTNCGLVYQNPRPTLEEMSLFYPDDYECYPVNLAQVTKSKKLMDWVVMYGMARRFSSVRKYKQQGRLLDIGCATGIFLDSIKVLEGKNSGNNWDLNGIEVSAFASKIAQQKGHNVFCGTLTDAQFPSQSFDVVTLWDVFEHLHDPKCDLAEIHRILKPDGLLVMRVPNLDSWDAKLFGKYWVGYEPPRHLYIFGKQTIVRMLETNGFHVRHMETRSSRYLTFILSLKFLMVGKRVPPRTRDWIVKLLHHPVARLLFAPLFFVYGMGLRGSLLTIVAVKK